MSKPIDAPVMLRAEIPDIKRFAEIILEGRDRAAACGWYYNHSAHYSEDLVLAMAKRLKEMAEVIEARDPLAAPGSRTERLHRGARAAVQVLSDGVRHPASEIRDAVRDALGISGSLNVSTYIRHAQSYMLGPGQQIVSGPGGRSYLMPVDEDRDDG